MAPCIVERSFMTVFNAELTDCPGLAADPVDGDAVAFCPPVDGLTAFKSVCISALKVCIGLDGCVPEVPAAD